MKQILLITLGLSAFLFADFSKVSGVVTDSTTTLQWQDDYSDNGGNIKTSTWTGAIDYCEALALDGGGWRLPNKKELLSLVDYTTYSPSIDAVFSNNISSNYWSSTTSGDFTSYAWIVHFRNGDASYYNKSSTCCVRCVR